MASLKVCDWDKERPVKLGDGIICLAKASIAIVKRREEEGHLCLMPLWGINGSDSEEVV